MRQMRRFVIVRDQDRQDHVREYQVPSFEKVSEAIEFLGEEAICRIAERHIEEGSKQMEKYRLREELKKS
jgi:hypothetical protein